MTKKTLKKYNSIDHKAVFQAMQPVFGFGSDKFKIEQTINLNRSKKDFSTMAPFFMFPEPIRSLEFAIL